MISSFLVEILSTIGWLAASAAGSDGADAAGAGTCVLTIPAKGDVVISFGDVRSDGVLGAGACIWLVRAVSDSS